MAEENADFGRGQRERIAGLKTAPRISLVELLPGEAGAVHRRNDLALDRQRSDERLDIGFTRNRALQMENKGLEVGQRWLTGQRPAIVPPKGARGAFISVDRRQVISPAKP